jgi:8-oxo-dGTP pyrophosphatase MutT (NUDIX family)
MLAMWTPDDVRAALSRHQPRDMPALPGRTNHLASGVLVPLCWETDAVVCLATVRAAGLRQHAGEVCFPGGRPDPQDADLVATALREANEELGMANADVLGPLSSIPLYTSDYRLRPWVAAIPSQPLVPNPAEVAEVLRFDIEAELSRDHIDAIPWTHPSSGVELLSPLFAMGEALMFGATAYTFFELLTVLAPLLDTEPPPLRRGRLTWSDVLPQLEAQHEATKG